MVGETTTVTIERCPPRRLLDSLRFRSFKIGPDLQVWAGEMAPARALVAAGWRMARVLIDWGPSEPLTPGKREEAARRLTDCHDGCEYASTCGSPGRGRTVLTLERA